MPPRFVIAIYTAGEGDSEAEQKALGEAKHHRTVQRYSALQLEGERLIAVEAKASEVEEVVKRLQNTGSPAIFVLNDAAGSSFDSDEPKPESKHETKHGARRSIFSRLRENEAALDLARRDLAEAVRMGHALTAAAEWILDNAYLIR